MKITILGRPEFRITITVAMINILLQLSKTHYDAHCRQVSQAGYFPHNFLFVWQNLIEALQDDPEEAGKQEYEFTAKFTHLDTSLKLCESCNWIGQNFTDEQKSMIWGFVRDVQRALHISNNYVKEWQAEVISA